MASLSSMSSSSSSFLSIQKPTLQQLGATPKISVDFAKIDFAKLEEKYGIKAPHFVEFIKQYLANGIIVIIYLI